MFALIQAQSLEVNQILITVLSGLIIAALLGGFRWIANLFKKEFTGLRKEVKLLSINQTAQDYACERSIDNGNKEKKYSTARDDKREKLIEEYELKNY